MVEDYSGYDFSDFARTVRLAREHTIIMVEHPGHWDYIKKYVQTTGYIWFEDPVSIAGRWRWVDAPPAIKR